MKKIQISGLLFNCYEKSKRPYLFYIFADFVGFLYDGFYGNFKTTRSGFKVFK